MVPRGRAFPSTRGPVQIGDVRINNTIDITNLVLKEDEMTLQDEQQKGKIKEQLSAGKILDY